MEDYYIRSHHQAVPAFGSWDWNNDLPFTQCFETAARHGLKIRYSYSDDQSEDRDLYVAGDLYQNDVVTPTIIAVPRNKKRKTGEEEVKGEGKQESWVVISDHVNVKAPKPVDEDLYKVSPDLLYTTTKPKKKGVMGFISNCLLPTCVL